MKKVAADSARLSTETARDAKPRTERYTIWDARLPGFGLRVSPTGVKTFIARYRVGGGRRAVLRQQVVGRWGTITADEARAEAKKILAAAELGQDPQAERAAKRAEMTVAELCDLYLAEGVATKKATTLAADKAHIRWHIKPGLKLKVGDVTSAEIERLARNIAAGKVASEGNAQVRGGRATANRVVGLLSAIFAFAASRNIVRENPARGVKLFKPVRRERFLSAQEMGRLGDVLNEMEGEGRDLTALNIVRLLLLTGARRREVSNLRWSEVDAERSLLRLKDSKTGAKVIPLGAAALEMVAKLPRGEGPYVFPQPGEPEEPYRGLFYQWQLIRKRAKLPELRLHDLRHSFASAGLASGQALPLIGKLLGHAQVTSTARYAHLADDPVKAAADRIAAHIAGALGGETADVRKFGRGGAKGG